MTQLIDVPGVGQVEFPEGMGDEEISSAIQNHINEQTLATPAADVAAARMRQNVKPEGGRKEGASSAVMDLAAQGIPLLGASVPTTPAMEEFEKSHPWGATAARTVGGTAAMAPLVAAAPAAFGGGALPLLTRLGIGAGSGGGIAAGDTAIRGGSAEDVKKSAIVGALFGGASPAAGALASRAVTPHPAPQWRLPHVDTLAAEGVPMTPGQVSGRSPVRYTESTLADLPFTGTSAEEINQASGEAVTRANLRRVGVDADRATPPVMQQAETGIGNEFNRLTGTHQMPFDPHLQNTLLNTVTDYERNSIPAMRSPVPNNVMNDAAQLAGQQGGTLTGRQYQNLRSQIGRMSAGAADPSLSRTEAAMRNALDDAMERHITNVAPHDVGAFGEVRNQYRNLLAIERAVASSGEVPTPAAWNAAARHMEGTRDFVQGQGDMTPLAQAAKQVLTPLPQSGTGPRENIFHQLQLAAILGFGGHEAGGLEGGLGGAVAGFALPAAYSALRNTPAAQAYLSNQLLTRNPGSRNAVEATVRALMQQPSTALPERKAFQ